MTSAPALIVAACFALLAVPHAHACSFSWKPGYSPDEIKAREDVRMVKGEFHFEGGWGELRPDGSLDRGVLRGRIETLRGTGWDTEQPYDQFAADCGAFLGPVADGQGVFWIERRKKNGRYQMLLWEGAHLPAAGEGE